jgi:hypothetical protein
MLPFVAPPQKLVNMDILNCPNCFAQLRPQDTDVIKLQAVDGRYQERKHCCPHCHTLLSLEVTLAEDDSPTLSRLRAIEL